MKYPVRVAVPLCAVALLVAGAGHGAGAKPESSATTPPRPCPVAVGPTKPDSASTDRVRLGVLPAARRTGGPDSSPPHAAGADLAEAQVVLDFLSPIKRPRWGRFVLGSRDEDAERWRQPQFRNSDIKYARMGYSWTGFVPMACLTASALTLTLGSGPLRGVSLNAKTWRAGGVIALRTRF